MDRQVEGKERDRWRETDRGFEGEREMDCKQGPGGVGEG